MGEVYIWILVTCPICDAELSLALRIGAVVDCLDEGAPLRLRAACHNVAWYATPAEVERIREVVDTE